MEVEVEVEVQHLSPRRGLLGWIVELQVGQEMLLLTCTTIHDLQTGGVSVRILYS